MNQDERDAFASWLSLSLASSPDSTIATLTRIYTPVKLAEARSWLALSKQLEDGPYIPPVPEDKDKPTCHACGRIAEHAAGGLTPHEPQRPAVKIVPETLEIAPAGSHDKPEPPPDAPTTPADLHCADEADCDAHRASQLGKWREKWETAERALQQEHALGNPSRFGYHGTPITTDPAVRKARPAWLAAAADRSEALLAGWDVVHDQVSAWITLTMAVTDAEEDFLALAGPAVPPLAAPQFAAGTAMSGGYYGDTLAHPRQRGHLVGGAWQRGYASKALPDATGKPTDTQAYAGTAAQHKLMAASKPGPASRAGRRRGIRWR